MLLLSTFEKAKSNIVCVWISGFLVTAMTVCHQLMPYVTLKYALYTSPNQKAYVTIARVHTTHTSRQPVGQLHRCTLSPALRA
jgi:CO dehydrogenase/acetyl-CoA synthase gamma subunit (corrinoid Fe-S protein)